MAHNIADNSTLLNLLAAVASDRTVYLIIGDLFEDHDYPNIAGRTRKLATQTYYTNRYVAAEIKAVLGDSKTSASTHRAVKRAVGELTPSTLNKLVTRAMRGDWHKIASVLHDPVKAGIAKGVAEDVRLVEAWASNADSVEATMAKCRKSRAPG